MRDNPSVVICPGCGKENPDGFAFCGYCTAPLAEQLPQTALEERKIVTVLFCDLVGFTAASEQQDPEDVRARIRPYHARLRQEIERYGGTVEKFVGDAVMAAFGAPVAHEDDVERAVRAGLGILESIEELNEADPDLDLKVRVGINTGEAVVAVGARTEQGEGLVTGDVVNTAARIQSAAPVNGVAVGEQTCRATTHIFEYEQLQPVSVKGKAEPLSLWRANAIRDRFGRDSIREYRTPFVGRELEKPLLIGIYERAAQQRSVQLVTIVGEPGVGKSRLVAELFGYIDPKPELIRWRQGRCLPYGEGITFWALGEIVKAEAGMLESDSAEVAAAKLEATVFPDDPERQWLLQRLAPLVGLEAAPAERQELFTAWRHYFEGLAAVGPRVLVFEDLHWADEALLAFLEYLVEWSQEVRCSWYARPGRSCTSDGRDGVPASAMRTPSTSHRSRTRRRPSSSRTSLRAPTSAGSSSNRSSNARAATRSMRRSSCACLQTAASTSGTPWRSRRCPRACMR